MTFRARVARWLGYFTLLAMTLIFTSVSMRFLSSTASNGAYLGMLPAPDSPSLGLISIRVGYGIYTLSFPLVGLYSLVTSRLRPGLLFAVIMMTLLLTVRILNGVAGGVMAENPYVLIGEVVMLTLGTASLLLGSSVPSHEG